MSTTNIAQDPHWISATNTTRRTKCRGLIVSNSMTLFYESHLSFLCLRECGAIESKRLGIAIPRSEVKQ